MDDEEGGREGPMAAGGKAGPTDLDAGGGLGPIEGPIVLLVGVVVVLVVVSLPEEGAATSSFFTPGGMTGPIDLGPMEGPIGPLGALDPALLPPLPPPVPAPPLAIPC